MENKIKGGKADKMSAKDIADKFNVSVEKVEYQIKKGVEVEMEHTKDRTVAREIALDHLAEDPKYYDKLTKLELEEEIIKYNL